MFWPCETRTSTCRNLATISSGLYRFLAITVLLDLKDISKVGPFEWGRISEPPPILAKRSTTFTIRGSQVVEMGLATGREIPCPFRKSQPARSRHRGVRIAA